MQHQQIECVRVCLRICMCVIVFIITCSLLRTWIQSQAFVSLMPTHWHHDKRLHVCVFWFFALNKIHISHYWYHHVFHSPGVSHLSSFVNFILITCLPPLPPLLFMVLVILPLLLWSCLYSKHNWMKCCCLDRIGTSIVSHQSPLQMTLLCQMTFHLWKEREEKR